MDRGKVVGAKGFEPSTSWSRTRRASQAALRPEAYFKHNNSLRGIRGIRNRSDIRHIQLLDVPLLHKKSEAAGKHSLSSGLCRVVKRRR